MTRRVYLYFTLTFLLGIVAGGAGTYFYLWRTHRPPPHFDPDRIVKHLRKELNLSDQQAEQITQILNDARQRFADLEKQTEPQIAAIRQESRDRIRQILTPEQVAKFNEIVRHVEERLRHERH